MAWHELIVEFPGAPSQRIDLLLDTIPEAVAELADEFLDEHGKRVSQEMINFLRSSRQVVSIGLKPDRPNDDVWDLLDQTQTFLATRLNGILTIAGDGVYDQNLQVQVDLGESPACGTAATRNSPRTAT